jgi:serine phosphatase RsbU (regulator of sigma subunit)
MALLVTLRGPETGRHYPLQPARTTLGRQVDCHICLSGKQVSRQHALIVCDGGQHFVEDLGSSNGTYLNGRRITPNTRVPLTDRDTMQVGPYLFALRETPNGGSGAADPPLVVRESVSAVTLHQGLFAQDPAAKLQLVLEIAQHLGRTLDLEVLLDKLVDQLLSLFPPADRALVIFCEDDKLVLRAQRARPGRDANPFPFSRTVVRRALDEGVGLLSDDVRNDRRFQPSLTITNLELHSVLCVPMINPEGKRLGAIQLDRLSQGVGFRSEDLHLLTAVALQVTVVLENVSLHAERLREERLRQELALAQDIQQGYLPDELEDFPNADFEVLGRVFPAREVAGDLYDFFRIPAGRLAFFIGDVSGKGMPAALFMVAVRTLCRHLAQEIASPELLLARLNAGLAADNPSCMFVTLAHGTYDPATGEIVLASGGHPPPLLRRVDGSVEPVPLHPGRLLGYDDPNLHLTELRLTLAPGELLVFFTDGLFEGRAADSKAMFGLQRVATLVRTFGPDVPLAECAEQARAVLDTFTGSSELQDDLTLLMLRRRIQPAVAT